MWACCSGGGLYLREDRLRTLIPLPKSEALVRRSLIVARAMQHVHRVLQEVRHRFQ